MDKKEHLFAPVLEVLANELNAIRSMLLQIEEKIELNNDKTIPVFLDVQEFDLALQSLQDMERLANLFREALPEELRISSQFKVDDLVLERNRKKVLAATGYPQKSVPLERISLF